tara:strand:+ start:497 stop:664 length:168 start_codon:yes stop_codon:yes gene_type:complete
MREPIGEKREIQLVILSHERPFISLMENFQDVSIIDMGWPVLRREIGEDPKGQNM